MQRHGLALGVSAVALVGCNAIFGIDDVSFGTGGGGGEGPSTSSGGGGEGPSTSSGPGTGGEDACAVVDDDIAPNGDFEDGIEPWEGDSADLTQDLDCDDDGDPCLHVVGADRGSISGVLEDAGSCAGGSICVELIFDARADETSTFAAVIVDYDPVERNARIGEFTFPEDDSFVEYTGSCRVPEGFTGLDALLLVFAGTVDFYLDNVGLVLSSCGDDVDVCADPSS